MPVFFDRYINLVDDMDILDALTQFGTMESMLDRTVFEQLDGLRYAPDKWTIKEILQHIIDNERVQAYRALRFARKDQTVLPGYDEQLFAQHADAERRSIKDLLLDFQTARQATLALFQSFTNEMLLQEGTAFKSNISVLAIGFVLVGHPIHHVNVIKERYLPLIKN